LLLLDLGQVDAAQKHLDQAAALREALVKDEPKNARYQADLAASRFYLHLIRARRFAEQKRNDEAEAVLAKIEAHPSYEAQAYKELGRIRFVLGQTDKATAFFRKAVESLPDEVLEELALAPEPVASVGDKLLTALAYDARLRRLMVAIERSPEDKETRWTRGLWYAHHARWKEAAADFRIGLEARVAREPQDSDKALLCLQAAPVLAISDREGYRWLCRETLKRFGDTQDPTVAECIAKLCLLLPDIAKEMERAYPLADLAVAQGKNLRFSEWSVFSKGLADYRRGYFDAAIEGLESVLPKDGDFGRQWTPDTAAAFITKSRLVLAMALYRQGDEKAAREHLTRAEKLFDKYVLDPVRLPIPTKSWFNHGRRWLRHTPAGGTATSLSLYSDDWLMAWLLHREAHSLIEGNKAEPQK
jgi:tetratricopeptide (TPR) repeat protein